MYVQYTYVNVSYVNRTGSHPHLLTQNLYSMGSILYLKYEKDSMDITSQLLILMTTQFNKKGVVSDCTHLVTSSD